MDGEHRIYNGNVFDINGFDEAGNIVLQNGWKIDKDFGHVAPGYVSTSHSSQGKTVDHVFVVESSTSFPAAGKEQLYVSVSRGRKKATILTDDLDEFRQAVSRNDERLTATNLTNSGSDPRKRRIRRQQLLNEQNHERDRRQQRKRRSNEGKSRSFLASYADTSTTLRIHRSQTNTKPSALGASAQDHNPMITFYKNDDYVEAISYANLNQCLVFRYQSRDKA